MLSDNDAMRAIRAISGEIRPNIRQVSFGYDGISAKFIFYMEGDADDEDKEAAEIIAANFDSSHPTKLNSIDIEFINSDCPFGDMKNLDFVAFRRWEST